jgi:hypothetical protein
MAHIRIPHVSEGGRAASGLIVGLFIGSLLILGLFLFSAFFDPRGDRDINVKLDAPKIDRPVGGTG